MELKQEKKGKATDGRSNCDQDLWATQSLRLPPPGISTGRFPIIDSVQILYSD